MATTSLVEAFRFHRLDLTDTTNNQVRGECPFCNKSGHFYVRSGESNGKSVEGMWTCKFCQEGGNVYTFLKRLIETSYENTTDADYRELWEKKNIPPAIAKKALVCKSTIDGSWMVPTCRLNDAGELAVINIHRWWEARNKLFGTTGLDTHLLGRQFLPSEKTSSKKLKTLYISEGHWDWLILEHVFRSLKKRKTVDILGAPGSGSFKEAWLKFLEGYKQIVLLFDNDHEKTSKTGKTTRAGYDGMIRIAGMCASLTPTPEIKLIDWPQGLADGYDVRDLFITQMEELRNGD